MSRFDLDSAIVDIKTLISIIRAHEEEIGEPIGVKADEEVERIRKNWLE